MDDVNINEICLDNINVDVEVDENEDDWIKLSWIIDHSNNDKNFQSSETQKDSGNEIAQMKDNDSKVSCINTESEDISDGISIITESDTDVVNTNLQICQFNRRPCKSLQILEVQTNKQKDIWNTLIAYVFGIIVGVTLSYFFTIFKTCPVSNEIDVESLKTASHNIVNTCKELTDGKDNLEQEKTKVSRRSKKHIRLKSAAHHQDYRERLRKKAECMREKRKKLYEQESEEQRLQRLAKEAAKRREMRMYYETPEQRRKRLDAEAARKREYRMYNETPEDRRKRLDREAERRRIKRLSLYANETPEQRRERLNKESAKRREARLNQYAKETEEERKERLRRDALRAREMRFTRSAIETEEERRQR